MSDDNKVVAEHREKFGKGAARKIRAVGKIPAVIYGHGSDPQHVTLPAHQVGLILRKANAVLALELDGKTQLTLVKDVQKDPVLQIIEHLDLIVVKKGEKVEVEVPVHVEGESFPGTLVQVELNTLRLEVEATNIPERVFVKVDGAEEGTQIHARDIELPAGAALIDDADALVLHITVPRATAAETADEAAAAEETAEAPAEESAE
ncbi:50S ribosomal protein L25/general stress protein Ctc [Leifsonia sp. Root112D2]|jgi:large subunit ribosomal protein L25|uniref:50S ribosomal protein L25/general stress protein Ctc n=1 Tax=Leifsonia sp. Root112D2 TaxID=1736426 RepID=UPI0006F41FBC|nr:50S ribosomal protein L25/general stress protein Ctc [Leifsonia sp. Root112D2]KQV07467.1 50S ribosomal protein L25 [Leifsonia sp. Root112D2]